MDGRAVFRSSIITIINRSWQGLGEHEFHESPRMGGGGSRNALAWCRFSRRGAELER